MEIKELIEKMKSENLQLESQKEDMTIHDKNVRDNESNLQVAVNIRNQYSQFNKNLDEQIKKNELIINELEKRAESEELEDER